MACEMCNTCFHPALKTHSCGICTGYRQCTDCILGWKMDVRPSDPETDRTFADATVAFKCPVCRQWCKENHEIPLSELSNEQMRRVLSHVMLHSVPKSAVQDLVGQLLAQMTTVLTSILRGHERAIGGIVETPTAIDAMTDRIRDEMVRLRGEVGHWLGFFVTPFVFE